MLEKYKDYEVNTMDHIPADQSTYGKQTNSDELPTLTQEEII